MKQHAPLKILTRLFLLGMSLTLLFISSPLLAQEFSELERFIGERDSILVTDPQGQILFSKHPEKKLIPASILKIFTSLVALHFLGSDYQFPTEFYLDERSNLKIKGYGDPLLISEVVAKISQVLAVLLKNTQPINDLVVDDSYFKQPLTIPGVSSSSQPYDAPNGALCVNFNTVNFKHTSEGYLSAEPQTPLLPSVIEKIKALELNQGRIVFSHNRNEITIYAGELFQYFLKKQGIDFIGKVKLGKINTKTDKLIFRYHSVASLDQIVAKLLEHSNNFVTNQLLIAAGAQTIGSPGTLSKGVALASDYAKNELRIENMTIAEGSGVSRNNRVSAIQMDRVLQKFLPYRHLMRRADKEFYKTGTLYGINTRAGYIAKANGELCRYVILLNTPGKFTDPIIFRLMRILEY